MAALLTATEVAYEHDDPISRVDDLLDLRSMVGDAGVRALVGAV